MSLSVENTFLGGISSHLHLFVHTWTSVFFRHFQQDEFQNGVESAPVWSDNNNVCAHCDNCLRWGIVNPQTDGTLEAWLIIMILEKAAASGKQMTISKLLPLLKGKAAMTNYDCQIYWADEVSRVRVYVFHLHLN